MNILYAENHAVFAEQVCRQFLSAHSIKVVASVAVALQALTSDIYDLLIVDFDLDDGKGDELVRAARRFCPALKIIAASAHEAGNAALHRAGASAVCSKMEFDRIESVIGSLNR